MVTPVIIVPIVQREGDNLKSKLNVKKNQNTRFVADCQKLSDDSLKNFPALIFFLSSFLARNSQSLLKSQVGFLAESTTELISPSHCVKGYI